MGKIKCLRLYLFALLQLAACSSGSFENPDKLYVEMLDVGQGLSFLIKGKECSTLYDTGTPNSGIDTMLQNRGIDALCSVIISHWHNDHYGGLPVLAEMAKNGKIRINRIVFANEDPPNLALFRDAGIAMHKITRSDTLADFLPWTARIIWPEQDSNLTENATSIAMRINDPQNSFLFMGDLEKEEEKRLMELEPLLSATAVQIGHHGSRTSSSWEFLSQIQPQMAFISAGKNNSYGHPHPETLEKLSLILPDTAQIFRTDQNGSVEIEWIYGIGLWRTL